MTPRRAIRLHFIRASAALAVVAAAALTAQRWQAGADAAGTLIVTVIDEARQVTPARVEVADTQKKGYVPEDAIPTGGD